jgi:hypothetical protein
MFTYGLINNYWSCLTFHSTTSRDITSEYTASNSLLFGLIESQSLSKSKILLTPSLKLFSIKLCRPSLIHYISIVEDTDTRLSVSHVQCQRIDRDLLILFLTQNGLQSGILTLKVESEAGVPVLRNPSVSNTKPETIYRRSNGVRCHL